MNMNIGRLNRTALAGLVTLALGGIPGPVSASCYTDCFPYSFCDQPCDDYGYERTCGDFYSCAQPCDQICGPAANCATYCDTGGVGIIRCQDYGSCDPATCQPSWVETSRTPPFNFYVKSWWLYKELWADQMIYETDVACGQGQRERCDPFLVTKCYGTADCCKAPTCWPGYSLCR